MFYRTHHHHFLSNFNYFPQLSPFSHLQAMESAREECGGGYGVETAAEMDEFCGGGGGGGGGGWDDFSVDELLDFSNDYSETEEKLEEQREIEAAKTKIEASTVEEREGEVFDSLGGGELGVQAESLESLEWVSHFMEDSFPDYSLAGKLPANAAEQPPCFNTLVQTKARTKRARTGLRVWPVLERSASPLSSTSSTTSFSASPPDSSLESAAPVKKKRKFPNGGGGGAVQPRRCSHCGVTKTPQWRAGPLGSKTLCNACGVRYKSGRLLPEYRPACSPTFSNEVHSNNHRKVLEMRRKKETEMPATGLPPPVRSF